ncbi:MAG TPA: metalloregulator ArsR/SmtB family transcription factor [Burkholderiales bacterium]|nr:metalloregulator ArsR/SmtB family transcription factor [Burkholderiales bacterium]
MSDTTLDLDTMRDAATEVAGLLRTLGNADRLLLLCQLTEGEFCVSELEACTGISQPTLSQQLGVLRNMALVDTRREGKNIYYRIADARALALLQTVHDLYCD